MLIADDNPDDRSLVIRKLSEEFPDCQFSQVTELSQLTLALERGPWDLVVTDYQLRWSDGLRVLKSVKSRWPECPVIMFTGTGSEEIAVQAMKAGLDDYVLKSPKHYARLPAAAVMALDRAKQRRALREALAADDRPRQLFQRAEAEAMVELVTADVVPLLGQQLGAGPAVVGHHRGVVAHAAGVVLERVRLVEGERAETGQVTEAIHRRARAHAIPTLVPGALQVARLRPQGHEHVSYCFRGGNDRWHDW